MEIFQIDVAAGIPVEKFQSNFRLTKLTSTKEETHVSFMYLPPGGKVGYHEAMTDQLLVVIEGEGVVSGENQTYVSVSRGDAVYWKKGEFHETKSTIGLTAVVFESLVLELPALMKESNITAKSGIQKPTSI
ncbi:cupin [Pontibacillus halophilus JSM 076056 = DSM 19796]|uniref:Cupin n=1 Tax=Pontibacillus halophilus JSM 076056 = DSM 19796 TaxID=1385510 RepID=A0A0A5GJE5_9BACI|nr:cupin domain-containing protein [Pontibacillus halophilus]KGX92104.1 cupin [Pontibacillus halophilus JSM 076056 = DSM 19796]